jgi:hypothetical protein
VQDTVKYELGQIVYRKISQDVPGMVRGILFRPECVLYLCAFQDECDEQQCYGFELSAEKKL